MEDVEFSNKGIGQEYSISSPTMMRKVKLIKRMDLKNTTEGCIEDMAATAASKSKI